MSHQSQFRSARPEDQTTITAFQLAMAHETEGLTLDPATCAAGVRAVFDDPSRGRYFVFEKNGAIIASLLTTYEWSDWRNGVVWWIHSLYVVPEERQKGVFSKMYQELKAKVEADAGIRGLRLYVDKTNARAQQAYRKLGMTDQHYSLFEWLKG